jgi:hypothetical protein
MLNREFFVDSLRFKIKSRFDRIQSDELVIRFRSKGDIKAFFNSAIKNPFCKADVVQIAKNAAPSYCAQSKKKKVSSNSPELFDSLCSRILIEDLSMVQKSKTFSFDAFQINSKTQTDESGILNRFALNLQEHHSSFLAYLRKSRNKISYWLNNTCQYEKVFHHDQNSNPSPVVVDPSSVQSHATEWKDWDEPFEIYSFGALKGLIAFNIASIMGLGNSAKAAAAISAVTENSKGQYRITGKSINIRKWYGSIGYRFSINGMQKWVKYTESGPDERWIIELKREDRVVLNGKSIFSYGPILIPPAIEISEFLSQISDPFPEHDVYIR